MWLAAGHLENDTCARFDALQIGATSTEVEDILGPEWVGRTFAIGRMEQEPVVTGLYSSRDSAINHLKWPKGTIQLQFVHYRLSTKEYTKPTLREGGEFLLEVAKNLLGI